MKRILVIIRNPLQASYRLRVEALFPLLTQRGFQMNVQVRPRGLLARRALLRSAAGFDAVLLQRKLLDPSDARLLRRGARRIVYDIDDAVMFHSHPAGWWSRWITSRRFEATAANVDHVVAGNEYLAEMFRRRGKPVTVLPTVVDPQYYQVKNHSGTDAPALVWIGSSSVLPYVEEFLPALEQAASQVAGMRLIIIADKSLENAKMPVEFLPWSQATEAESLCRGDIGIAPTPDNRWTRGKCGFKIVQYMAAGLPVIASPVGANGDLVMEGENGFLPTSAEEWTQSIIRLANDAALRERYGQAGRQRVEREYHLERAADTWADLLRG